MTSYRKSDAGYIAKVAKDELLGRTAAELRQAATELEEAREKAEEQRRREEERPGQLALPYGGGLGEGGGVDRDETPSG